MRGHWNAYVCGLARRSQAGLDVEHNEAFLTHDKDDTMIAQFIIVYGS